MSGTDHSFTLRVRDGVFVLERRKYGESHDTVPHVTITRDTAIRIGCFTVDAEAFKLLVEKWNQSQDLNVVVQS